MECKQLREKPWVAFAHPVKEQAYMLPTQLVAGELAGLAMAQLILDGIDHLRDVLRPPQNGGWIAHGVVRASLLKSDTKASSDSDPSSAYSALRGITTAAHAIAKPQESVVSMNVDGKSIPWQWLSVTAPLIVIDAPLFRYCLSETGSEELERVAFIHAAAPNPNGAGQMLVRIVIERGLPEYLEAISLRVHRFCEAARPHVAELTNGLAGIRAERTVRGGGSS